jgi:outer membrane protein assembly factor BamB
VNAQKYFIINNDNNMENLFKKILLILIAVVTLFSCSDKKEDISPEDSWYSYMHDQQNSGISSESLSFPLKTTWERKMLHAPQPAWPAPAKQDYYNAKGKLEPLVTYDRAFHPIIVQGKLFTASSANNSINCFDANTGEKVWQFYTEGPNRNAPLWHNANLYFGSDDGYLYCLSAESGELRWKKNFGSSRKLIGNGRLISATPIRTGVVAKGDTLFLASGLLPEENVSVIACKATNGEIIWNHQLNDLAPQGYPVISDSLWYVPNSRVQPMAFNVKTGEIAQKFRGLGGDYVTLVDDKLIHGVNWQGEIKARNFLEAAMTGYKVVGDKNRMYIASEFSLNAVDVKNYTETFIQKEKITAELKILAEQIKKGNNKQIAKIDSLKSVLEKTAESEFLWQKGINKTFAMIKISNAVIVGQQNQVKAFDVQTGEETWSNEIKGRAYGLAVCGEKLYVSTDKGVLYCFGEKKETEPVIEEVNKNYYATSSKSHDVLNWANKLKKHLPRKKGITLLFNTNKGDKVHALAQTSKYYIIGLEDDKKLFDESRNNLDETGIYGLRSVIFQGKLGKLNLSDYLVNVAVLDEKPAKSELSGLAKEISRILSPSGGRLLLTSAVPESEVNQIFEKYFQNYTLSNTDDYWIFEREKLPESGEWTHLYANPANTVSTGDSYASNEVKPLWFGQPGPREMSDRHHRAPSPLFQNGILYIPKDNGIIAADAYNGTLLWEKDIPHFRRIKISRDAGNIALNNDILYAVAENYCFVIDGKSGEEKELFRVPILNRVNTDPHWGYLATKDEMLYGSGRKSAALYNQYSRLDWSEHSKLVCSDYLFALDRKTGKTKWTYKNGAVLTPSICIGDGKMFFVESMNEKALNDEDGLIQLDVLKKDLKIVALNSETGDVIWKKAFDFKLIEHILFGSCTNDVLVMSGSGNRDGALWYGTYAFDTDTGHRMWGEEREHLSWTNGSHGEQIHRAMIMDGTVFTEPFAFDLKTGKQKENWKLQRNGQSCGTISGANDAIFFRGTNPSICIPAETDQGEKLNNTSRPGCWINIIPAGGLVLIPEASSGCACNFPLQMSIVYQPQPAKN